MSDLHTQAASLSGKTDTRAEALRFTPLRCHVIARPSREKRDDLALSRIIPKRRFEN